MASSGSGRGIPPSPEWLLDYDVIEAFCVTGLRGRASSTRGTYRSALYRLAGAAHGPPGQRATPFAGALGTGFERMINSGNLGLAALLFCISVAGIFINRKNIIILLMAIELMLLAVNLNFIAFSHYLNDPAGQVFVFFILTVAAAESAIGLAILVLLFRTVRSIDVEDLATLKH